MRVLSNEETDLLPFPYLVKLDDVWMVLKFNDELTVCLYQGAKYFYLILKSLVVSDPAFLNSLHSVPHLYM